MPENQTRFSLVAGFLFWLSVAYFFYRYGKGAALHVLIAAGLLVFLFLAVRFLGGFWRHRLARRPSSLLPRMNFSNVKPKDFE
ncbi:MAG: hypothetical protein O2807_00190 [bacterium]|nr:hypothetical protein [bacterium]